MVVRKQKRSRKYLGTRRWGAGNIKNRRGKGDRGGVGGAGVRKHNFTWMTAKAPWLIKRKGFTKWNQRKPAEMTLRAIAGMEADKSGFIVLDGYKVLSNGSIDRAVKVKATGFTKAAMEKIKQAGGEAIVLGSQE